jgi:hypothetical protein
MTREFLEKGKADASCALAFEAAAIPAPVEDLISSKVWDGYSCKTLKSQG